MTAFNRGNTTREFINEVLKGNIPGHKLFVVFGVNQNLTTTRATIWPETGLYVFPTTAGSMTISSDSANDTAAGTGARVIAYEGLDDNYDPLVLTNGFPGFSTVALNGTTPVPLPSNLFRINRMATGAAGSSGVNEGNVYIGTGTVTAGKPATVFELMPALGGLSQSSKFTVANGFRCIPLRLCLFPDANKTFQFFAKTISSTGIIVEIGPTGGIAVPFELEGNLFIHEAGSDVIVDGLFSSGGGGLMGLSQPNLIITEDNFNI